MESLLDANYNLLKELENQNSNADKVQISGYIKLPENNIKLQSYVYEQGCAAVSIDASDIGFQTYKSGIYKTPQNYCYHHNHAVAIVGYGYRDANQYWVVKNCWGKNWGDKGFVKITNGPGDVGITKNGYLPYFN